MNSKRARTHHRFLFLNLLYGPVWYVLWNETNLNINFKIVGVILAIPRDFYVWRLSNGKRRKSGFLSSCCSSWGHWGLFPQQRRLVQNQRFCWNGSLRKSKGSADDQFGHGRLIFMAQRGCAGMSRTQGLSNRRADSPEVNTQKRVYVCLFLYLVAVAGTATYPKVQPSQWGICFRPGKLSLHIKLLFWVLWETPTSLNCKLRATFSLLLHLP